MTNQAKNLIEICQRYMDGHLNVDDYISTFEDHYLECQEILSSTEFNVFDDIYMTNDSFEPNVEIRKEDASYLDETTLMDKIQKDIIKLTA